MRPFFLDRTSDSVLAEDTGTLQGLDQAVELVDHIGQRGAAGKRAHRGSGLNRTGGTGRAGGASRTGRAGGTGRAGRTGRTGGTGRAGRTGRASGTIGRTGRTGGASRTSSARSTCHASGAGRADRAGGTSRSGAAAAALRDRRTAVGPGGRGTYGRTAVVAAAHAIALGLRCLAAIPLPGPKGSRVLSGVHGLAGRKIHHAHDLQPSLCRTDQSCDGADRKRRRRGLSPASRTS